MSMPSVASPTIRLLSEAVASEVGVGVYLPVDLPIATVSHAGDHLQFRARQESRQSM